MPELEERIKSVSKEDFKEYLSVRVENPEERIERHWNDVPDDYSLEEVGIERYIELKLGEVMNLSRKVEFYYNYGEGWSDNTFCSCGADHKYECNCPKKHRRKYKSKVKNDLGINRKLMVLQSLQGRVDVLGDETDPWNRLDVNLLEGNEDLFPELREKIVEETGSYVPR